MGRILVRRGVALCAALGLGGLALLCWAPGASADLEFCPPGEGAGQCASPDPSNLSSQRGLALDYESGRLYVADQYNNRVDVFEEDGGFVFAFGWGVDTGAAKLETCTTASACQAGLAGAGSGQFNKPTKVAVDNDSASPSHHDVYVVDQSNSRVEKFDPTGKFLLAIGAEGEAEGKFMSTISIDVGPGGILYALDNLPAGGKLKHRLQRFKPSGELIPPQCILFEGGRAISLAVDSSSGSFWVATEEEGIRKYDPNCALLFPAIDTDLENIALALDETGNLFASQREVRDKALGSFKVITAHNPVGVILSRFAYGKIPPTFKPEGLAVRNGGEGGIFVSVRNVGIRRLDYPPPPPTLPSPGPIVASPSLEAINVGSAKATEVAEINPEGKATEVHFEYLTQSAYQAQGESFIGPATKKTPAKSLGAAGFKLKAIEALFGCPNPATEAGIPGKECLTPETTYRWRVIATNADNPTGVGEGTVEGPPFTTKKSPELGETYATRVGADTAHLNGEVDPNGVPATGYFEYVDDATYQADVKKAEEEAKSPEEAIEAGFDRATRAPDEGKGQAPLDFGAGEAFITRGVAIFPLLPGTVYHYRLIADNPLVEPKIGKAKELRTFEPSEAPTCLENEASRIGPGAFLPDCRAYEMVSPLDKGGSDIRVLENLGGGLAVLEQSSSTGERLAYGSVRSFGGAASAPATSQYIAGRIAGKEWQSHPINPPRGKPIIAAIGQLDTEFKAFSADLCDTWLATFAEFPQAPPGTVAGVSNLYQRTDELCGEDGKAHYEALAPIAAPEGVPVGVPFLIGLLGVSADGTHAAFEATGKLTAQATGKGTPQLYESVRGEAPRLACILPGGGAQNGSCTAGSAVPGGPLGSSPTMGADPGGAISSDGERVFWSAPGGGNGKLYVRIDGVQTVAISEAAEKATGTSKSSWFWGSADDGSEAVFSTQVEPSVSNLYEFDIDGETTTQIAQGVVGVMGISNDASRVYFASTKVLSGEETNSNGDKAQTGKANLYLHEVGGSTEFVATLAGADLTQAVSNSTYLSRTSRVSPDGVHTAFVSAAPLTGYDNKDAENGAPTAEIYHYDAATKQLVCVSCNPSGARPAGPSTIPALESNMHGARVLSDDGSRLYFQSADALAARDTNGRIDVYQWEEPGAGGCAETDAGFSAAAGGCVELISSGQSPQSSRFVEASPSGNDVFFATVASLLPQDFGVFDIYDARVGGGLPIPIPPKPPCEGDACHAQIPAPEEQTPASSGYVAPPEALVAGKPAKHRCAKGKRRVSRQGKSRCITEKHRRRRAAR